ncbi:MAG: ABC transporter permease [Clostridia bacterium]|nr:ABC transporter permease [Clostridia bacterium]
MSIINTLTVRHLKLNKQRTVVTIIGVILSVTMLTAVPTFVSSFLNMMQRNTIEDAGNWHVLYQGVPSQNIDEVGNDKNTAYVALGQDIGYAPLSGSRNEDKPYLFIKSYDNQGFATYNIELVDGRFPQKSSEIVISSHIADNSGITFNVGDTIKLDVGQRYQGEGNNRIPLGQDFGLINDSDDVTGETFVVEYEKEYTITGIINKPTFERNWAPGYTVISYFDRAALTPTDTVDMSVIWKDVNRQVNDQALVLAENAGVASVDVSYNRDLLRYYGIFGDNFLTMMYALAAIVIAVIITGSVALIYNSFAISISERSRYLGMLSSVGATKNQKAKSVLFEALIVGIIGIPIGLILGTIGMNITFMLTQPLIANIANNGVKLTLVTSPKVIAVAVLLSILTIFISAFIPARRASRVSPIDAIRQSQDIRISTRNIKTSKLVRLIFGFEAELGLKNLKRNSRRYKVTIFSLVISIVLFLSVSSLSLIMQKSAELATSNVPYDVKMYITSEATKQEKWDFYTDVQRMDYVDQAVIQQHTDVISNIDGEFITDEVKALIQPIGQGQNVATYETFFWLKSIDEDSLSRYAAENGIDFSLLRDTTHPRGILVNKVKVRSVDNKYFNVDHFNIQPGERLKFTHQLNGEPTEYSTEILIAALADKTPIGETTLTNPNQAELIVSEEIYAMIMSSLPETFENSRAEMLILTPNPEGLTESIKEYQKQTSITDLYIYDAAADNKKQRQVYTFVFIFFYGFVAIISTVCVANIFNTISTSVSLRKREFAMLKSIGMTPQGFNKMIRYESLLYGIKALIYGLPISFALLYLMYRIVSNSFTFAFIIPWSSIILAIIAIFAMVSLTMLYASSKIKKENIIDLLRNENI